MEKKKRKINIFDIAVIVLALAAAAAWYMISRAPSADTPEIGDEVTYIVELTEMDEGVGEQLSVGDELIGGMENYDIGEISDITVQPQTIAVADYENGVYTFEEVPGQERIVLEITAKATESDSEILLDGGYVLKAWSTVSITGPGYKVSGTVMQIVRGEALENEAA